MFFVHDFRIVRVWMNDRVWMVVLGLMLRCLVLVVLWSVVGLSLMVRDVVMMGWKRRHLLPMREQRLLLGRKTFDRASLLDVDILIVYL